MSGAAPLAGLRVLVTRPAHQAEPLCAMIEHAGGIPLRLPALDIGEPSDTGALAALARRLDDYDIAVFVSPNAVDGALRWLDRGLPSSLRLLAVGPATARALSDAGYPAVVCADSPFNSESLLTLPELREVHGKRVVIFRGDGGRGLLGEVLDRRGAEVEYAEVYQRALPAPPRTAVATALRRRQVDAVVVTSGQALEQLVALCNDDLQPGLLRAQLVVSAERMVKLAESLGFRMPLVAAEPGDRALVETLVAWRTGQPPQEIG